MTASPKGAASRRPLGAASNVSVLNAVLGLWLACSALLWPHAPSHRASALITGAVIVAASLASARRPRARYIASAAAVWLLLSSWSLPASATGTFWNNLLVSFAVFFVSLVEPEPRRTVAPPQPRGPRGPATSARR